MTRRIRAHRAALGCIALAALLLAGCHGRRTQAIQPGDVVPALVLDGLEGGGLDSSDWRGRTVVLNLWATWCAPCRQEMPSLEALSRALDPARFKVIGLSLDTDRNLVREFALHHGVTFPLALDSDGHIATGILGTQVLPDTLIIAPDGRLADRVRGGADWYAAPMRQRVLAAGQAVERALALPASGERILMGDRIRTAGDAVITVRRGIVAY